MIDERETFFCNNPACRRKYGWQDNQNGGVCLSCGPWVRHGELGQIVYGIPEIYFQIDRRGGVA